MRTPPNHPADVPVKQPINLNLAEANLSPDKLIDKAIMKLLDKDLTIGAVKLALYAICRKLKEVKL